MTLERNDETEPEVAKDGKGRIWFKLTYSIASMFLKRSIETPAIYPLTTDAGKEIIFWMRTFPTEKQIPAQLCCSAVAKRSVNETLNVMFEKYSNGILPRDSSNNVKLPIGLGLDAAIDEAGNIPKNHRIGLSLFPQRFQQIQREMFQELVDMLNSYVKTLRWVQGAAGKQSPFAYVDYEWSFDKSNWYHMPDSSQVLIESPKGIDVGISALSTVSELWNRQEFEPIAHELVREALDLVSSNPRSALLIGCTALETGLKHYIEFLLPNSGILLEKMPSPPALTLIQDVIPQLHEKLLKPRVKFLTGEEREFLQKWILQRNQITHGIKHHVDQNKCRDFLKFVRTILYRLDEHRGHTWVSALLDEEKRFYDSQVVSVG